MSLKFFRLNQTIMGLKYTNKYFGGNFKGIKSDHNGIEIGIKDGFSAVKDSD